MIFFYASGNCFNQSKEFKRGAHDSSETLYEMKLEIWNWAITYTRNTIKCKNKIEITIDYMYINKYKMNKNIYFYSFTYPRSA